MAKLSELCNDTMLTVQHRQSGGFDVMEKSEYMDSAYYLDWPVEPLTRVTVAEKITMNFNLGDVVNWIGQDETHEDWEEAVINDIETSNIDVKLLEEQMNKIFEQNSTYYEGQPVEIDIEPDRY